MAGSRAENFVGRAISRKSPGWTKPSGWRDSEDMNDGTYIDESLCTTMKMKVNSCLSRYWFEFSLLIRVLPNSVS